MASNTNEDLIRSHVDTIILSSLMKEDKYGLEILNEIKEKSNGLYTLKQATLYSILKRLEKVGFIKSYDGTTSNGAQRVYYTLLEDGRNTVLADQYEWEYSRTIINNLLSDKPYDPNATPPFDASSLRPLTKRQPAEKPAAKEVIHEAEVAPKMTPIHQELSENIKVSSAKDNDYTVFEEDNYQSPDYTSADHLYHNPAPHKDKPSFDSIFNTPVAESQQSIVNSIPKQQVYSNSDNDVPTTNYISSFENLYKSSSSSVVDPSVNNIIDDESYDFESISDLKTNFAREGFIIRPYIKKNTTEYYVGKYYKANKLLLFSTLAFYFIMLIEIFSVHFGLHYENPLSLWLSILAISIIPGYAIVKYILDPQKRSLAKFNLKSALINSLIIIINLVIIIVIVGYFAYGANFDDPNSMVKPIFVPLGMLINIPLAIGIYQFLYQSKYFHIN